jgi:hypothetical protein
MVNQIRLLRRAGVPLNIYTIRGLMIGHIEHHAPALLLVKLADGSTFSCSDLYVRKFLKRQMNFVPRTSTRAAQKVPANAAEVLWQSFLRLVYACWKRKVMHPQLRINFDQTQVVVQTQGGSTFEEEGAKQVAVVGKEEKRAWTAVVAVAASGDVLPLQIVMKGSDPKRSLPKATAPMMDEANTRKFDWALGGHTYWSNLETMKTYFVKIVVVWFDKWKTKLGLPSDQTCIVQLDVWSVHRSAAFLTWVNDNYPWIELHFVPGGCTGLFQPCDVGIQRPFKQAIKRAQLADIVNSTIEHLRVNEDPAALELDVTIGKLRSLNSSATPSRPALFRVYPSTTFRTNRSPAPRQSELFSRSRRRSLTSGPSCRNLATMLQPLMMVPTSLTRPSRTHWTTLTTRPIILQPSLKLSSTHQSLVVIRTPLPVQWRTTSTLMSRTLSFRLFHQRCQLEAQASAWSSLTHCIQWTSSTEPRMMESLRKRLRDVAVVVRRAQAENGCCTTSMLTIIYHIYPIEPV